MPIINTKKSNTKKILSSVTDVVARRSQQKQSKAPMLTTNVIRAGTYHSTVISVEDALNDEGKAMADVTYRFRDERGRTTEARVRYLLDGYHISKLIDAWMDAGLPEGAPLTDAVGIEEEVTIVYPHEGALGKIKNRKPLSNAAQSTTQKRPTKKTLQTLAAADEDDLEEEIEDDYEDFLEEED